MAGFRYGVALVLVVTVPTIMVYWFSVHSLIRFWRRVGLGLTLTTHLILYIALAGTVIHWRRTLLQWDLGTQPVLIAIALAIGVVAVAMRRSIARHLKPRIQLGFPEIAPAQFASRLLTEGIFSRIRHPRYVNMFLAVLSFSLIANYLMGYVVVGVFAAELFGVVLLEEKELRERFGREYEAYMQRVPRFIPRLRP